MRSEYPVWLKQQGYDAGTIAAQIYRVQRAEEFYGSLEHHFLRDKLESLIDNLTYSTEDQRKDKPNPSKIPFNGNKRNNLASYKSAVLWYRRFLEDASSTGSVSSHLKAPPPRRESRSKVKFEPRQGAKTLADFGLNGRLALEAVIASSQYLSMAQAVASLTLFTHPDTVRQTGGKALFPAVRDAKRVGEFAMLEGRQILLDDNTSATEAFLTACPNEALIHNLTTCTT